MKDALEKMREQLISYARHEAETMEDFLSEWNFGVLSPRQIKDSSKTLLVSEIEDTLENTEINVLMHPFKRQKDGASPLHRHAYFEMGFVFAGECISISDGEETHLREGDLFIVSLQALHQMKTFSLEDYVFNIMIRTSLFDQQFFQMIAGYDLFSQFFMNSILNIKSDSCLIFRSNDHADFTYYVYKLLCESLFENKPDQNYIRLLLACIFRELSRQYQQEMEDKSRRENEGLSISAVLRYLAEHYANATLQSTAEHFHYTARFMSGFIAKYTGSSFVGILRELKLQNASHLVAHTTMPFSDIAQTVGYNERGYLDRVFKKRFGKTMKEYRSGCEK